MCTSFVSYYKDALMGFNYDFRKSKTYISVRSNGKEKAFLLYSSAAKRIYPQYMMNSLGLFVALQNINDCPLEYINKKGEYALDYDEFIEKVLFESSAKKAAELFDDKGLYFGHDFRVEMKSLQIMICDKEKESYILNFDKTKSYRKKINGKSQVMTNFACCLGKPEKDGIFKEVYRYDEVKKTLEEKKEKMTPELCIKLLKKVRNDLFSYTLFTAVFDAKEKMVYFCINREYEKILKFDLISGEIEDYKGYKKKYRKKLTDKLLLLDTLNQQIEKDKEVDLFDIKHLNEKCEEKVC